jgi:hypothetical protein
MRYWSAFNEHQTALGGDPFVGVKLGDLLHTAGFREIQTTPRMIHLDSRRAQERAALLVGWTDLLLSGAPELLSAGKVSRDLVQSMTTEMRQLAADPHSIFYCSFVQARCFS